jgi:hypothetical protein
VREALLFVTAQTQWIEFNRDYHQMEAKKRTGIKQGHERIQAGEGSGIRSDEARVGIKKRDIFCLL